MGKTCLAAKAAHDALAAGEFAGGVAWVNGELEPSLDECLRQMMRVFFGDRMEQESIEVCSNRLAEYLERGDALVLLDNFETVAHESGLIRWLAGLSPQGADPDHDQRGPAWSARPRGARPRVML